MKFRIASDFHNEFYSNGYLLPTLPVMEDEKNTVLLLGGDIGVAALPDSYMQFATEMSNRFLYVVHIAGNHEFYGTSFCLARKQIKETYKNAGITDNVGIFEREVIEFDNVRVILATLWSDFDGGNPKSMILCGNSMNDYRKIFTGTITDNPDDALKYRLRPEDTLHDFKKSRDFIFDEIENAKNDNKKIIVMTHHAPTRLSISYEFKNSDINGAFVSDLSEYILDSDVDMTWIHGHVHSSNDYNIGKCRVICNPHGYYNENPYFDPKLVIDI